MNTRTTMGVVLMVMVPAAITALMMSAPVPTEPTPSAYSPDQEDFSAWKTDIQATGAQVKTVVSESTLVDTMSEPANTILVVPQPRIPPDAATQESWHRFLANQGTLVLLDGGGTMNRFLLDHGAAVADRSVLDPTSEQPRAVQVSRPGEEAPIKAMIGWTPAAILLEEDAGWKPLLVSKASSFLDMDQNEQVDQNDLPGPHVLAARLEPQNGGTLIIASSTTFFANELYANDATSNNDQVMETFFEGLGPESSVIIDESLHGWSLAETQFANLVRRVPLVSDAILWTAGATTVLVAAAVATWLLAPTVSPYKPHRLTTTSVEPHEAKDDHGFFAHMAKELQSHHSKAAGATNAQLEDLLSRASTHDLRPTDKLTLLQLYEPEVNQHA